MLNVEIAVAKAPKYAVRESGDSVGVVERPRGGISVVMADGQRSGRSAKAISNLAVRRAMSLLSEGVRHGAALDPLQLARSFGGQPACSARVLADSLLDAALTADDGRPGDDVAVVVVQVLQRPPGDEIEIRRLGVTFPVPAL